MRPRRTRRLPDDGVRHRWLSSFSLCRKCVVFSTCPMRVRGRDPGDGTWCPGSWLRCDTALSGQEVPQLSSETLDGQRRLTPALKRVGRCLRPGIPPRRRSELGSACARGVATRGTRSQRARLILRVMTADPTERTWPSLASALRSLRRTTDRGARLEQLGRNADASTAYAAVLNGFQEDESPEIGAVISLAQRRREGLTPNSTTRRFEAAKPRRRVRVLGGVLVVLD
jgi:hypothetical protein